MNKSLLSGALNTCCTPNPMDFDIRIFLPKRPWNYRIFSKLPFKMFKKKKFSIKNIDVVSGAKNSWKLEFEVYPNQQGLVGMCYNEKAIVFDDNLEETNSDPKYKLGRYHLSQTSELKWCICSPIFDENDEVVAILALDGKSKTKIDCQNKDALVNQILTFSTMLYGSVPQLFRR